MSPRCKFKAALAILLVGTAALVQTAPAQPVASTGADIKISAVDINENPLPALKAGEYARLEVEARLREIPDKAQARVTASATFTTFVLGRRVSYSVSLPLRAAAGSSIDPSIGLPGSGKKLGSEVENRTIREIFDFHVPAETPAGELTISVKVTATSATRLSRTFRFQVVR